MLLPKNIFGTMQSSKIAKGTRDPRHIEYFDSISNFISRQKLQQPLKFWSNFNLVLFGKWQQQIQQFNSKLAVRLRKFKLSKIQNRS